MKNYGNTEPIDEWTSDIKELEQEILKSNKRNKANSIGVVICYALLSLLLTPLASLCISIFMIIMHGSKSIEINSEIEDVVRSIVSYALAFPLWLSNRIVYRNRVIALEKQIIPYVLMLGVLVFVEYIGFSDYFISLIYDSSFSISYFIKSFSKDMVGQWLFSLPLVVIWVNLLSYSGYIRISKDTYDMLENIPSEVLYIFYAVAGIVISLVIRFIAILMRLVV